MLLPLLLRDTKGDKYILGRKQIDIALKTLDQERRALLKARDQGGVIAVEADGVLITAYRFDSTLWGLIFSMV